MKTLMFILIAVSGVAAVILVLTQSRTDPFIRRGTQAPVTGTEATHTPDQPQAVQETVIPLPAYADIPLPKHMFQTFNNCGPATLSMILATAGIDVSQAELGGKMRPYQNPQGDNDDKSIFTEEFVRWATAYDTFSLRRAGGDIDMLKRFTARGIPVVVKTWLHQGEDIGHFRVVRGYDDTKQLIIQGDSYQGPDLRIPYREFLRLWQPFNYEYMIVVPKDKESVVMELLGEDADERVSWEHALRVSIQETKAGDSGVYPVFNASVSYYHLGQFEESVAAFESVESGLPARMLWYQTEPIRAYLKIGKYDRVFAVTDRVLAANNRAYSELYDIRRQAYEAMGNQEAAAREQEKVLQYNRYYDPTVYD